MKNVYRQRFFAASNSAGGFRNYFNDIFSPRRVDHLYIIKGGPGTGKSYFMKSVSRRAAMAGYSVTEYACSSDPDSLDGLILHRLGVPTLGFLDGTAPHVAEVTAPGVREELIDLGAFWDASALIRDRDRIGYYAAEKAKAYADAYAHLSAAGAMFGVADRLAEAAICPERVAALTARLLRGLPISGKKAADHRKITVSATVDPPCNTVDSPYTISADTDGEASKQAVFSAADGLGESGRDVPWSAYPTVALRRAVGMTGRVTLPSYERMADTVVLVGDAKTPMDRLLAARVMGQLYDRSVGWPGALSMELSGRQTAGRSTGQLIGCPSGSLSQQTSGQAEGQTMGMLVSRDPIYADQVDGLFYPSAMGGTAVLPGGTSALVGSEEETGVRVRTVSVERCADSEVLRGIRPELRRVDALRERHEQEAVTALRRAHDAHFALEKIYTAAMDIPAKEAFCERFCERSFG